MYKHYKQVGATGEGKKWLEVKGIENAPGLVTADDKGQFTREFIDAVKGYRFWQRRLV